MILVFGIAVTFIICAYIFIVWLIGMSRIVAGKQRHKPVVAREEDFWDEIDGGTYVTLPNGNVRLDNNGKQW